MTKQHPVPNNKMRFGINKSFARRVGKSLSNVAKDLIANYLPSVQYKPELLANNKSNVFLEIGFGMGEHFIHQLSINKNDLFIGAEAYLNGVANVLNHVKDQNLSNFLIWPDDIDLIISNMPDNSINGIYILFPDPWHKTRHRKKRLFNEERYEQFVQKLKPRGFIVFASDIADYFKETKNLVSKDFTFINKDDLTPHENYVITKYHQKAITEGRIPQFFKGILR